MSLSPIGLSQGCEVSIAKSAVALMKTDEGSHAALFYLGLSGGVQMCHFCVGGEIVAQPIDADEYFAWTVPAFDELQLEQIQDLCETMSSGTRRVPFAFKYAPPSFQHDVKTFRFSDGSIGFTCATFVMAVFHIVNVNPPPIDHRNWEQRTDDVEWQQKMARYLEKIGVGTSDEHESNRMALPCFRFRPEEVVSSARFSVAHRPVNCSVLEPLGKDLLSLLGQAQGPPRGP